MNHSPPIYYLINWNALSDITPLHKKDSKSLSENYRPISLTSIICEIGEKFVFDWMHTFWQETGLINNNQFGFLKGLDPPSSQWMTGLNRVICLAQRRWFSLTWPSYAKVLLTSASRCSWKASVLTAACMPGSGTSWQDAGSAWFWGELGLTGQVLPLVPTRDHSRPMVIFYLYHRCSQLCFVNCETLWWRDLSSNSRPY